MNKKSKKVIGIDFGTTNSCVAYMHDGKVKVLENAEGRRVTPTCIAFIENNGVVVDTIIGDPAKRQASTNPHRTFYMFKRLLGRRYSEVAFMADRVSYTIVPLEQKVDSTSSGGDEGVVLNESGARTIQVPHVTIAGSKYSAEYLTSLYVQKLVKQVSTYAGEEFDQVCITVPSNAGDAQRQATKLACELAGLKVLRITNESTAAALAYGLEKNSSGYIVVFDFGGGTFDVTVLHVEDGVFTVIGTGGDDFLGGEDIDMALARYCNDKFKSQKGNEGIDLFSDTLSFSRLVAACKEGKEALAHSSQVTISSPFIYEKKHLEVVISRSLFNNEIVNPFIVKCLDKTKEVLAACDLKPDGIDSVVLAGGSTRLVRVEEALSEMFGADKIKKDINPDECVAIGAGIQGSIITSGSSSGLAFSDVTSMDVRVGLFGGSTYPMITRNTLLPARHEQVFSTVADDQTSVSAVIYQGNSPIAEENYSIGEVVLTKITKSKRSESRIVIVVEIDVNGIITVSAEDKRASEEEKKAGASFRQTLHPGAGLSKEKIEEYRKKAEQNKERDELRLQHIETDSKVYNYQYEIGNMLGNLTSDKKKEFEETFKKLETDYKTLSDTKVYDHDHLSKKQAVADKYFELLSSVKSASSISGGSGSAPAEAPTSPQPSSTGTASDGTGDTSPEAAPVAG